MTSATAWFVGQKQGLLNVSNARIQLRLSNPDEIADGQIGFEQRRAARNTLDRPGFGLTRDGHELLVGVPEIIGTKGERVGTRAIGALIAEVTGAGKVETLARLPERVALSRDHRSVRRYACGGRSAEHPVRDRRERPAAGGAAEPDGARTCW